MPQAFKNNKPFLAGRIGAGLLILLATVPATLSQSLSTTRLTDLQRLQLRGERPARIALATQTLDLDRSRLALTADDSFDVAGTTLDDIGRTTVRYVRRYKGLRVLGAGIKAVVNREGTSASLRPYSSRNVAVPSTTPTFTETQVRDLVAADLGEQPSDISLELIILPANRTGPAPLLVWLVKADAPNTAAMRYYIDAGNGRVLRKGRAHVSDTPVVNTTGHTYYSGQVLLKTRHYSDSNLYKLQDTTRGDTFIYDVMNTKPTSGFHGNPYWDTNNFWGNGEDWKDGYSTTGPTGQTAAVDAMLGARVSWDLLKNIFQRDGLDDIGSPMKLRVHVREKAGELYGDAHWDGYFANFGDGKTSDHGHRAELPTVIHELGHGIWTHIVAEENEDEARGLNEGHGDIMSAIGLHYYYLAGGTGGVVPDNVRGNLHMFRGRNVNPWAYQASDGSTGLPYYVHNAGTGGKPMGDYEEHTQGNVYGRMFVTLSAGAPSQTEYEAGAPCTVNSGSEYACLVSPYVPQGMVGTGIDKAAQIWYRATLKFDEDPTFHQVRDWWLEAAAELFGNNSPEYKSVMNAFRAVAIGPEATDSSSPTIGLGAPLADAEEESLKVSASATDDIGVHRIEMTLPNATKVFPGSLVTNRYMSLAGLVLGQKTLTARAYDSKGKNTQAQRNFLYGGANHLISNRGFESGGTGWTEGGGAEFNSPADSKPFLGSRDVVIDGTSWIRQQFTVPSGADTCRIGYRVSVKPGGSGNERLYAEVLNSSATSVLEAYPVILGTLNTAGEASNNYDRFTHSLNSCAGKTYWIRFRSENAENGRFRLDNVFVTYVATPTATFDVDIDENEGLAIFHLKNIANIDPFRIDHVEMGSPGGVPAQLNYAPYMKMTPTSNYITNATYQVRASIVDQIGVKVYNSPVVGFEVKPITPLLNNGGFEANNYAWVQSANAGWCTFNPASGQSNPAFYGSGCAQFTGTGLLYQQVSIPAGGGTTTLTLRAKVIGTHTNQRIDVGVQNVNTLAITNVGTIWGTLDTDAGVSHKGYRKLTYNLSAFQGQTVRIRFASVNNSGVPMLFYVDQVGLATRSFGVTQ